MVIDLEYSGKGLLLIELLSHSNDLYTEQLNSSNREKSCNIYPYILAHSPLYSDGVWTE